MKNQTTRDSAALMRSVGAAGRAARAIVLVIAMVTAVVVSGTPAHAAAAVSTTRQFGFPRWYEDDLGVRLEPCLDNDATRCVLLAEGTFDPAQEVVFPTNFPPEFFYSIVDSDIVSTPGCQGTRPGKALVRLALEGAFANGDPVPGDQVVFARTRVTVSSGLCPNAAYTFTHPYGQVTLTTDVDGSLARNQATTDIGCVAGGCTFSEPLTAQMFRSFLRWDPGVAPASTPGYLSGDATVLHPIVGASGVGSANLFRVSGPGFVGQTNLFTVAAKVAGPLHSDPMKADLGNQPLGFVSTPRTITITNVTKSALTVTGVTVTPTGSAFSLDPGTPTTCTGALAAGASCTAAVRFAPQTLGATSASLEIAHSAFRSPTVVALVGAGTDAVAPAVTSQHPAVAFDRVLVGTTSTARGVVVHNAGPGAFVVDGTSVVDDLAAGGFAGDAARFLPIAGNDCPPAGLEPGLSCTILVTFTPSDQRPAAAELRVAGHVGGTNVPLSTKLTGRGSIAASSAGADGLGPDGVGADGFPTWYQDNRGVRVQQCFVNDPARCVLLAEPGFDPAAPVVFSSNYPPEAFYYIATSDLMNTPGCGAASPAGRAGFRAAVEQTFASGAPTVGEQMVFDRVRLNVTSGLCPGRRYTFVHPYGELTFVADDLGGLSNVSGTTDIGCVPGPGVPCNFQQATNSPVSEGFLRWDTTAPAAPAGFLGDPNVVHPVVGAPYMKPGSSTPQNRVELVDTTNGSVVASTNLFSVSGQIHSSQTATRYTNAAPSAYPPLPGGSPLAFADQVVGTTSLPRTVTVESVGTTGLTVAAPTIAGLDPGDFAIAGSTCAAVPVGAACTVSVTFTPTTTGARTATLTVPSDAANPWNGTIRLVGNGTGAGTAGIQVAPASVAFADQLVGTTSAAQTVTVTNTGTAPLTVTGVSVAGVAAGDFASTNACAAAVAPAGTCTVSVTFTPTAAGTRGATLTVASNAPGAPPTVGLSGAGTAPAVAVAPASLTFAAQLTGTTSAGQAVTVSNPGSAALSIGTIGLTGANPGDFVLANACPASVAAGASCTVTVAFRPAASGARAATLSIATGAGPASVALSGTGAVPAPVLTVTPASLSFAARLVTTTSPAQAVTVANTGTASMTVSSVTLAGANPGDFTLTNGCTTVLAGASCNVSVAFRPTVVGARSSTLSIVTNAGTGSVTLAGTGTAPAVSVAPASLTFAAQVVATTSATQAVTISNPGTAPLAVSGVTLGGANPSDFVLANACTTVAAGGTCTFTVAFRPSVTGTRTAAVSVATAAGTVAVALSGTGVQPRLAVTPTALAFGSLNVGSTSAVQTVTVSNTGIGTLTLSSVALSGLNPGDFVLTNTCASVAAGGSCAFGVAFRPTAAGTRTASVSIVTNAGPATIVLTGTATQPVLTVTPTSLAFAAQLVGTTSATRTVTVSNTGTGTLLVSSVGLSGLNPGDFIVTNGCGSVGAGVNCVISIAFRPAAAGARSAALSIVSNGGTGTVALSGTAIAPAITVSTTTLAFGNQRVLTSSVPRVVTISNTGTATLTVSSVSISGLGAVDFALSNACGSIAVGGSCTFTVSFRPLLIGTRTATVDIASNAGARTVALSGNGTFV